MGKGDFGKTPSVWRPSELGGADPFTMQDDPWSSGIVETTQVTEYSYPPAAELIPIPQPWHLFYQNKAGALVTKTGATGTNTLWAFPTDLDMLSYPRFVVALWFNFTWTAGVNAPIITLQSRNSAGTWENLQISGTYTKASIAPSPRDIVHCFTIDVAVLGSQVVPATDSSTSSLQVEGTAVGQSGTITTPREMRKNTPTFDYETDELFADGDDGLGGFVQNNMRPSVQEMRLLWTLDHIADILVLNRAEMWGSNAKGALHGEADSTGRYPIGGGTAL